MKRLKVDLGFMNSTIPLGIPNPIQVYTHSQTIGPKTKNPIQLGTHKFYPIHLGTHKFPKLKEPKITLPSFKQI